MRTPRIDPIAIPLGWCYPLPGGITVYHYPELPAVCTAEEHAYRQHQLAALDLAGHRTITTMEQLAEIINEAAHDDRV